MLLAPEPRDLCVIGKLAELPFGAGVGSMKAGFNECSRGHDNLETGRSSDVIADVKQIVPELDDWCGVDVKHCVELLGHSVALSALKTTERTVCANRFLSGSLTSCNDTSLALSRPTFSGEH
jgi:hypothetical protein